MEYLIEIIIAVLALVGTLIGSMLGNSRSQAVMQEQIREVKEDINTLSSRVDKHNHLIERMAVAESKIAALEHKE